MNTFLKFKKTNLLWVWLTYLSLIVLSVLYLTEIRPWLQKFTIYSPVTPPGIAPADTYTYWYYAKSFTMMKVPYNLLGPTLLLKIFKSFDFIFLLNICIFAFAIVEYYKSQKFNTFKLAALTLINPLIMFQFFGPDKEIFIINSLLFLILYKYTNQTFHLMAAIFLSFFSKMEFCALVFLYLFLFHMKNTWRWSFLSAGIFIVAIFYNDIPGMNQKIEVLLAGQNGHSNGISMLLQELASKYHMYPFVIMPKALLNIFEGANSVIVNRIFNDFEMYNFISGLFIAFFSVRLLLKNLISFKDNEVLLIFLFILMVSTVPFPHHRYIMPIYIVLIAVESRNREVT